MHRLFCLVRRSSNSCFSWWLTMILNANWIVYDSIWFICLAGRKGRWKKHRFFIKLQVPSFRIGFSRRLRVGHRVGNAEALGQIGARSPSKSYRFTFLMFPWVHHDCRSHHDKVLHSWWGFRLPFTSFHQSPKESSSSNSFQSSSEPELWPHHVK